MPVRTRGSRRACGEAPGFPGPHAGASAQLRVPSKGRSWSGGGAGPRDPPGLPWVGLPWVDLFAGPLDPGSPCLGRRLRVSAVGLTLCSEGPRRCRGRRGRRLQVLGLPRGCVARATRRGRRERLCGPPLQLPPPRELPRGSVTFRTFAPFAHTHLGGFGDSLPEEGF